MINQKNFEAKKALVKEIAQRLTDVSSIDKLGTRVFPKRDKWQSGTWDRISQVISDYLEEQAKQSKEKKILSQTKVYEGGVVKDFIYKARIGNILMIKRKVKDEFHERFISKESVLKAWAYAENRSEKRNPGNPTWNKLSLFLNAFDYNFDNGYQSWEEHYIKTIAGHDSKADNSDEIPHDTASKSITDVYSELYSKISAHPYWKKYSDQIFVHFDSLKKFSLSDRNPRPFLIVITGPEGTNKTQFINEILQKYLLNVGLIRTNQVVKFRVNNSFEKLQFNKNFRDGILIIDGLFKGYFRSGELNRFVKKFIDQPDYKNTCIVLSGHHQQTIKLVKDEFWKDYFIEDMVLRFYAPSHRVMADLFEKYAIEKHSCALNEMSKQTLMTYFANVSSVKKMKRAIHNYKASNKRYKFRERIVNYNYEIFKILDATMLKVKTVNKGWIDPGDIAHTDLYQNSNKELDELFSFCSDSQIPLNSGKWG